MTDRPPPSEIQLRLREWRKFFWFWNISHYILGLTATIGSVFLAVHARNQAASAGDNTTLSIVVTISTAILTFAKASAKANAYIQAWRILEVERIAYVLDPTYTDAKLSEFVRRGEEIIGKSD